MTTSRRWSCSVLAVAALVTAGTIARDARAAVVTAFDGSITDVGVQRGPGQVGGVEFRIHGRVALEHPIDLSTATMILEHLFVDVASGGLGELMTTIDDAPVVPLELVARDSNRAERAVFDMPPRYRPHIRVQLQQRKGELEFRVKLDRGLMRKRPRVCEENTDEKNLPLTPIRHAFVIDDGVNPPLVVDTTEIWQCTKPTRYHMRSQRKEGEPSVPQPTRTPGPVPSATPAPTPPPSATAPPSGANRAPTASLRSNQHGLPPGVVELDGSASSDRDGVVVRYRFDAGDGRVQDGPDPVARFTYAPGDYRATLVVFDDRGAASAVASRGFSVND